MSLAMFIFLAFLFVVGLILAIKKSLSLAARRERVLDAIEETKAEDELEELNRQLVRFQKALMESKSNQG